MNEKNKLVYILIHGFGGHPSDVYGIKRELIACGVNENRIYTPCLKGHKEGQDGFEFNVSYTQMINELVEYIMQLKNRNNRIVLVGYSMGALVSTGVVLDIPKEIYKLVVINMPIYVWNFKNFRYWFMQDVKIKSTYHLRTVLSTFKYRRLRNSFEFLNLERYINKNLDKVNTDIFIAQSTLDYIADPTSGEYIYNKASSKRKILATYEHSSHFVANEPEIQKVVFDVTNWLK